YLPATPLSHLLLTNHFKSKCNRNWILSKQSFQRMKFPKSFKSLKFIVPNHYTNSPTPS
ncbi:unnamed protein product, partial [Musa textilis]